MLFCTDVLCTRLHNVLIRLASRMKRQETYTSLALKPAAWVISETFVLILRAKRYFRTYGDVSRREIVISINYIIVIIVIVWEKSPFFQETNCSSDSCLLELYRIHARTCWNHQLCSDTLVFEDDATNFLSD